MSCIEQRSRIGPQGRGFTMIEVAVSLAVLSILIVGVGSSVLIATKALPGSDGASAQTRRTNHVTNGIAKELHYALFFAERTAHAIAFTVADRDNDGDAETIRYAWAAQPGDPLTRKYNDEDPVDVLSDVHDFDLTYFYAPRVRAARVLLVKPDTSGMIPADRDEIERRVANRRARLMAWRYRVEEILSSAPRDQFQQAISSSDVAYITCPQLDTTELVHTPIGVVVESLSNDHRIATNDGNFSGSQIEVSDTPHEIMAGFEGRSLTICSSPQSLVTAIGTVGGNASSRLATNGTNPMLMAIEAGENVLGGVAAAARRVKLPWNDEFDLDTLTADGLTIMRRAIKWAAGPKVLNRIRITIETVGVTTHRPETEVQILNRPGVSGP